MIERMYSQTATTQRQSYVSGSTIKMALSNNLSSFPCMVQPMSAEYGAIMPGGFSKMWIMFCAVADIKAGDKVVVDGTDEYRVSGVETYDFGKNDHMEVTMTAFKE